MFVCLSIGAQTESPTDLRFGISTAEKKLGRTSENLMRYLTRENNFERKIYLQRGNLFLTRENIVEGKNIFDA